MIKHFAVALAMIVCCNTLFAQTDEKGIVLGIERSTADAFSKHNPVFLTAVFADDITVVDATGNIITKQQLVQTAQNVNSATVTDMKVKMEGIVAIITGSETVAGKDANGNTYSNTMRFTDVLLKTKGQWQIISRQETIIQ